MAAGWGSMACRMRLESVALVGASPRGVLMQAAEQSVTEQGWPAGVKGDPEAWGIGLPGTFCPLQRPRKKKKIKLALLPVTFQT